MELIDYSIIYRVPDEDPPPPPPPPGPGPGEDD